MLKAGLYALIPAMLAGLFTTGWAAGTPDTRLVEAVKSGNRALAISLLQQHVDVNVPEADGSTALLWAAHQGDLDMADRLIRAGADAKVANRYEVTALWEAAVVGNPDMIGKLLKAGADVKATNEDGETVLMVVARTGNVASAKLLIEHGADVNAREKWRDQTALMWAAAESQPAMTKELIAHGADLDGRSKVNNWQRQVTGEPRAKFMPLGGWTPLLFAARQGCFDCAKGLVEAGADINLQDPDGVSPLVTATVNAHYDVAAYLVEKGADVNLPDRWGRAGLWAVVDMHTIPHSKRPDPVESETVGSSDLLKLILAHGANVNAQLVLFPPYRSLGDRGSDRILSIGATPLVRAAKAGDAMAIGWLIEKGANVNTPTKTGTTPVMAAAGLDSRDSDTRGRFKTQAEAVESIKLLLDAGADINAADDKGQTALHGAAFWGYNDVVKYLAQRGAKLDAKDKKGLTPIDSAMGRAGGNGFGGNRIDVHQDTADLLSQLMAGPTAQNLSPTQ